MRSQPAKPGSRWLLHSEAAFGIALPLPARNRRQFGCGCSSVVEHDLAKVGVEGSSPFARSKILQMLAYFTAAIRVRAQSSILSTSGRDDVRGHPASRGAMIPPAKIISKKRSKEISSQLVQARPSHAAHASQSQRM